MSQAEEFFRGLFAIDKWPPRWECGYWSDFHGWLYIISELMIWLAYFLIPLLIINYFNRKRTAIRFRRVYLLFASFILLCGSTHFIDAMMFWVPMYRFNTLVRLATAIISLVTVYHLLKVLPDLFRQKTNVELEREIARRIMAEKKLEEANRGLEAFAFMASHDLQEPLRKITINSAMVYEQNKGRLDEQSIAQLQKVQKAGDRMRQLITDVLMLTTLSKDIALRPVETKEVVQEAIDSLEVRIGERNAVVTVGTLPNVLGHEAYLQQVFQNLISNAIKFNNNRPVVSISGEQKDGEVIVKVTDNGIGIDSATQEKMFTAFERGHPKTAYEGSGIGLAIVQKIMTLHGGSVTLESTPGKGSVFSLHLRAV